MNNTHTTPNTPAQFTKTDALLRLRACAAHMRNIEGQPSNARCEVGSRIVPVVTPQPPSHDEAFPADDDLVDFEALKYAAKDDHVRTHGAVVHMYLYEPDGFDDYVSSELVNVAVFWMGTPDAHPYCVDFPGSERFEGMTIDYDGDAAVRNRRRKARNAAADAVSTVDLDAPTPPQPRNVPQISTFDVPSLAEYTNDDKTHMWRLDAVSPSSLATFLAHVVREPASADDAKFDVAVIKQVIDALNGDEFTAADLSRFDVALTRLAEWAAAHHRPATVDVVHVVSETLSAAAADAVPPVDA